MIVLLVALVAQIAVQTKPTQGRLRMHPIVIFGSTIAGGALFGLLGAALSTPIVAIASKAAARLSDEPSEIETTVRPG